MAIKNIFSQIIFLVSIVLISLFFANFAAASEPIEFMLAWDANDEADIDGYEVYYRTPGSDYELLGDVYIDELADPDNPMVIITDLYSGVTSELTIPSVNVPALAMVDGATYNYAVTAFDTQGNISDFSDDLCLEVTGSSVAGCRSLNGSSANSDGSGGGGGGGGCFIATTIDNPHQNKSSGKFLVMYLSGMFIAGTAALWSHSRFKDR